MWRMIPLLMVPVSILAQSQPLSLLTIEEDPGGQALQLRNLAPTAITCYVVGYQTTAGRGAWSRWDLALQPDGELFPPGGTRRFGGALAGKDIPLDAKAWKVLAILYADGTFAGDMELVHSLVEDRQVASSQIAKALDILSANADARSEIESWFEATRKSHRVSGRPYRPVFGRVLPIMAELTIPSYVRRQLNAGITQAEIVEALKNWQSRLQDYKLVLTFV